MTDIVDGPKPTIHQLPWPRLNCLLDGMPGFSIISAMRGGIADGEVMAICGGVASFKTTLAVWITAHFAHQEKKLALFTADPAQARMGLTLAKKWGLPLSAQHDPVPDVFDYDEVQIEPNHTSIDKMRPDAQALVIDGAMDSAHRVEDEGRRLKQLALVKNIPVFFFIQISRAVETERRMPVKMHTSFDHVVVLDPTQSKRKLVMDLTASRRGTQGSVLLNTWSMEEVL